MSRFRQAILAGLAVLVSCMLAGCAGIMADSASDTKLWQGTWTIVSSISNGEPQKGDLQWIVDGDHYTVRRNGHLYAEPNNFTLDAGEKQIEVFRHDVPPGTLGATVKGIYEISQDSLRVCYDPAGREYPSSFDAGAGSHRVLYVFQRR
jgi:uncharacterized protein (TIGR03067 family)